jgi:hypothetical protein
MHGFAANIRRPSTRTGAFVSIQTNSHNESYIGLTRGAIDCDGHILEPPDLWENYLEPRYRDRAIKIVTDNDGYECLQYDGQLSKMSPPGFVGILGAMGNPDHTPSPTRKYVEGAPFGSMNPKERVQLLDREGLAKSILYPTLGILWEAEV